jgi:hypothetical protein
MWKINSGNVQRLTKQRIAKLRFRIPTPSHIIPSPNTSKPPSGTPAARISAPGAPTIRSHCKARLRGLQLPRHPPKSSSLRQPTTTALAEARTWNPATQAADRPESSPDPATPQLPQTWLQNPCYLYHRPIPIPIPIPTPKKAGDRTKYTQRLHSKEMRSAALNKKLAESTKFHITEHAIRSPSLRKKIRIIVWCIMYDVWCMLQPIEWEIVFLL